MHADASGPTDTTTATPASTKEAKVFDKVVIIDKTIGKVGPSSDSITDNIPSATETDETGMFSGKIIDNTMTVTEAKDAETASGETIDNTMPATEAGKAHAVSSEVITNITTASETGNTGPVSDTGNDGKITTDTINAKTPSPKEIMALLSGLYEVALVEEVGESSAHDSIATRDDVKHSQL